MFESLIILRMVERIIAVLIGGIAIYLGYRLFYHLPFLRENEGQLELPGVKVVLSRVGPGVFFAAFGSAVLFYSFTNPVIIDDDGFIGMSSTSSTNNDERQQDVTPQQRGKALTSIEMLNCAQRILVADESKNYLNESLALAIRDAKVSLLLSVWKEADWGMPDQIGVAGLKDGASFQLRSIFDATYEDCQT